MAKLNKPYTEDERKVMLLMIDKYPTNLRYSFMQSSKITGRPWRSVSFEWYKNMRYLPKYTKVTVGSSSGFSRNVKNNLRTSADESGVFIKPQLLHSYSWLVEKVMKLPRDKKDEIIDILLR